jgi:hypothetical protein
MKFMEYSVCIQELLEEQAGYGFVEDGFALKYGHIPHIAPMAYNIILFRPLEEKQIAILEEKLKKELPKPYRSFLTSTSNGMHLFHRCLHLYGLQGDINREKGSQMPFDLSDSNVYERPTNADASCFFIGGYSYDGSELYMRDGSQKVFYCQRWDITPLKEWSNFETMLVEEIQRLRSIHSNCGILQVDREKTLPID